MAARNLGAIIAPTLLDRVGAAVQTRTRRLRLLRPVAGELLGYDQDAAEFEAQGGAVVVAPAAGTVRYADTTTHGWGRSGPDLTVASRTRDGSRSGGVPQSRACVRAYRPCASGQANRSPPASGSAPCRLPEDGSASRSRAAASAWTPVPSSRPGGSPDGIEGQQRRVRHPRGG